MRSEVGKDRERFGRSPCGLLMLAYSIVPPGATTQRAGIVSVQLGVPSNSMRSTHSLPDGAQFVGGSPAQAGCLRDLAARVDQARERKPVSPLGLSRLLSDVCCETAIRRRVV